MAVLTIAVFPCRFVRGFIKSGDPYEKVNVIIAPWKKGSPLGIESPKERSLVPRLKAKGLGRRREAPLCCAGTDSTA